MLWVFMLTFQSLDSVARNKGHGLFFKITSKENIYAGEAIGEKSLRLSVILIVLLRDSQTWFSRWVKSVLSEWRRPQSRIPSPFFLY